MHHLNTIAKIHNRHTGNCRSRRLSLLMLSLGMLISYAGSCPAIADSDWEEDSPPQPAGKTQLQGGVQETGVAPIKPQPALSDIPVPEPVVPSLSPRKGAIDDTKHLEGKVEQQGLEGFADDSTLSKQRGELDTGERLLKGSARQTSNANNPQEGDYDEQELAVEWDRWRNRLLRAIQLGVQEIVNNPESEDYERPRYDPGSGRLVAAFPMGTVAYFDCQITAQGEVRNLVLIKSSGFRRYDRAVLQAVQQLQGSRILRFPSSSQRKLVRQAAGIKTAESDAFQYYKFGDVERVKVPQ